MALSEFEIKRYEFAKKNFLSQRRPHKSVRDKCDLDCRLDKQTMEVFEIRSQWDDPQTKNEYPLAKANYDNNQKEWNIYCMGRDLKWRNYRLNKTAKTIEEVFAIIDCDESGIFFG